jgi:hypothetical protein
MNTRNILTSTMLALALALLVGCQAQESTLPATEIYRKRKRPHQRLKRRNLNKNHSPAWPTRPPKIVSLRAVR